MRLKAKFAIPEPGDGLLTRARKRLFYRQVPTFPRAVQIQTRTGCNADCIWCPYGETFPTQAKGTMEWGLFERIVEECARHKVRRISPYLMNEPFLDRDLPKKIAFIHEHCPSAKVVVTTNGSMLRPDVVKEILDLGPALRALYISFQGIDKESYEATMRGRMQFEQTLEHVHYLVDEMKRRQASYPEVWITMVDTNVIDAKKAVRYWQSRGVRSKYTTLENRGGNIKDAESFSRTKAMSYYTTCTRLFKQAYIMFNGDLVLCCVDYSREQVLGNIVGSSIYDVWNGEVAKEIRRRYLGHEFDKLPLCGNCRIDEEREVSFDEDGREVVSEATDD
jgi:MoaA/NifB/PqqE/SkfB family radical SAM enzyme